MAKIFSRREKNLLKRVELRNQRMRVAPLAKNVVKSVADNNIEVLRSLESKVAAATK